MNPTIGLLLLDLCVIIAIICLAYCRIDGDKPPKDGVIEWVVTVGLSFICLAACTLVAGLFSWLAVYVWTAAIALV